jgi:hypothetical protein
VMVPIWFFTLVSISLGVAVSSDIWVSRVWL